MDQAKRQRHQPYAAGHHGFDVVERGQQDARGDHHLDDLPIGTHHAQGGQAERDGMGEGERGDHAGNRTQAAADARRGLPASVLSHQHRRQQQGEQEGQVIDAAQDVVDALAQELHEGTAAVIGARCRQARTARIGLQDVGLYVVAQAPGDDGAVRGILVEDQVVCNGETRAGGAVAAEGHACVGDAVVRTRAQRLRLQLACRAGRAKLHMLQQQAFQRGPLAAQLTPGDGVVAIRVERHGKCEVA